MAEPVRIIACRACGEDRPLADFRLFKAAGTPCYMDFCVHCEKREGTITLYRRFNAYATPVITEAVFAAERAPAIRRSEAQLELLVVPEGTKAPESKEELIRRELARRELARRRLLFYVLMFQPEYKPGWAHQDICRRLEKFLADVVAGRSPRLMIAMPPRSGKTQLASDHFVSWALGLYPHLGIIGASYAQSLPIEFSRNIRDRLEDEEYRAMFPETRIRPDSRAVEAWKTTKGGGYIAAGVGVGINGRGCFVAGTQVTTRSGTKNIEAICAGDEVASVDHETGAVEFQAVLATHKEVAHELIEFESDTGATVRCTPNHEINVGGGKYVEAQVLGVGSPLVVARQVREVRRFDSPVLRSLSSVLQLGATFERCATNLHAMFEGIRAPVFCAAEGVGEARRSDVLQCGVLARASRDEECEALCALRAPYAEVGASQILQSSVPRRSEGSEAQADYVSLRRGVSAAGCGREVLQPEVRERITRGANARREELELQRWSKLRVVVSQGARACTRAGQSLLRHLQDYVSRTGAPHQRGEAGQPRREPRAAMPAASPVVSQRGAAVVGSRHVRTEGVPVYDLRVAKNSNYFANSVLVHNCHIGIGDDLLKDAEAAQSETIRSNTHAWYQSVFRTRLAPGGGLLLIGTRWSDGDVQGMELSKEEMLRKQGVPEEELECWDVVKYPAIAEADEWLLKNGEIHAGDLLDGEEHDEERRLPRLLRKKGEALHPERYPLRDLMKLKHSMASQMWSALYQQNPTPDDGDFFKASDLIDRRLQPEYWANARRFIVFDLAISQRTAKRDFTVGGVFALTGDDSLYLLEVVRGRWNTMQIVKNAVDLILRYDPETFAGERGQIYEAVWPLIRKELEKHRKYVNFDESLVPIHDKEVRARPLQGRTQVHKFFFSFEGDRPDVYNDVRKELLRFPNGTHDDCVDTCAWGARLALNLSLPSDGSTPRKLPSWKDRFDSDTSTTHMAA